MIKRDRKNKKIAVLGAGRLGTTIAYAIKQKKKEELKIISISSMTQKSLDQAKKIFGKKAKDIYFTKDNQKAAQKADIIFICTPDDAISSVCEACTSCKPPAAEAPRLDDSSVASLRARTR